MVSAEYIAGFMDGEGYIAVGRIPRSRSPEFPVRVVLYNTNRELLEAIRQHWGGTLSCSPPRKSAWKAQHALIWTNAAAAQVIARVAPHLRVKSRQAAAVLWFHEHLRACQRARDPRGRLLQLSSEELQFREAFHRYLKSMNARGASAGRMPFGSADEGDLGERTEHPSVEYLAGFLDAEGSVMVCKSKPKSAPNPRYQARLSVSNTCRSVLVDIRHAFGGNIYEDPRAKAEWKPCYQLVWTGNGVERILRVVIPHLLLKGRQAELLLEFVRYQRSLQSRRRGSGGTVATSSSDEVADYRERLYRGCRELNAKGRPQSSVTPAPSSSPLPLAPRAG